MVATLPSDPDTQPRSDGAVSPEALAQARFSAQPGRWKWLWWIAVPLGLAAAVLLLLPWVFPAADSGTDILLHTVKRSHLTVTVTEQGSVESSDNTEIKCKVRGYNTVTWVIPSGSVVKKGDELVRLDTRIIDETVSLTKTNAHLARATLEETKARVAQAQIAIEAYLEGRFRAQHQALQRDLTIAEANLLTARKMYEQSQELFDRGFVTDLEVDAYRYAVMQAELEVQVKRTQLEVLEKYTKEMELETLRGNLAAALAKLEADKAGLKMDEIRRDRAEEEQRNCIVRAPRDGMVIYPSVAAWKDAPDITEGATVVYDQVLLLMPDLEKMQVKVGVHESVVDRVQPGQKAIVRLPEHTWEATVSSVARVTRPSGWWTGNVVKYDTIVKLPPGTGLKPGLSAEVEIILAEYENVLTVPIAAVLETDEGAFCWVKTPDGFERRTLRLGDNDEVHVIVEDGLKEGDQVVLNPTAHIEEADRMARGVVGKKAERRKRKKDEQEPAVPPVPAGELGT